MLAVTVVIAIVAVSLGIAVNRARNQADTGMRVATVQELIAQAQAMLAGTTPGGDARAFHQILAAHSLAKDNATDGALYTAVAQRASTLKIITGHTGPVTGVAFSPDGTGWPPQATTRRCGGGRLWLPRTCCAPN